MTGQAKSLNGLAGARMNLHTAVTSTDFGGSFIYVAGLPKSASSLMWLVVSTMQEESGRADPGKVPNVLPSPFLPLQLELMDTFRRGGVFSGHAPLTFDTNMFLRATLCRYVVHLRHPADFIVALYCHGNDDRMHRFIPGYFLDRLRFDGQERWSYALSAIDAGLFDKDKVPIEEALSHLLRDGALFKAMAWMCDWLAYRDPVLSTVNTYEGLVTEFEDTINKLCLFVRGQEIDTYRLDYLKHVFIYNADEGRKKEAERYPRGWTGTVGIWKSYFNADHVALYNDTVNRFLLCYPKAEAFAAIYGNDLFLS